MSASALPKPERINQVWLEEAMGCHEKYLQGIPCGQRRSVSFKDGRNLASADMVAAELSHPVFEGTCLARSNPFGTNLECANLREAWIDNARFVDCNLSGADLRGTAMDLADLRGAVGMRS